MGGKRNLDVDSGDWQVEPDALMTFSDLQAHLQFKESSAAAWTRGLCSMLEWTQGLV